MGPKRATEMEVAKVTCLTLLVLILEQRTAYFILSTTSFSRRTLYLHRHAPVVQAVEIVRESARPVVDVASRRLDGANEIVRKGLVWRFRLCFMSSRDEGQRRMWQGTYRRRFGIL